MGGVEPVAGNGPTTARATSANSRAEEIEYTIELVKTIVLKLKKKNIINQ